MKNNKIILGSANPIKIKAVSDTCKLFSQLENSKVLGVETDSGVSEQPMSLEETIAGAINRAKNVFKDCELSVGVEGGLFKVDKAESGYMNTSACVIWDGHKYYIGLSPSFEPPKEVIKKVQDLNTDISHAYKLCGLTSEDDIGRSSGAIGILSDNIILRKDYIMMGLNLAFYKYFTSNNK